jgi:hypothetical protein
MRVSDLFLSKFRDGTVRRCLFVWAVAFWLGGFMFYGGVVIDAGAAVLGSHVKQGFITERVTDRLNLAGAVALPVILWNLARVYRLRGRVTRFLLVASWLVMAAVQVELFVLHPYMDRLLDASAKMVLDYDRFDTLHTLYLTSSSIQWAAGVVHVWCAAAGKDM